VRGVNICSDRAASLDSEMPSHHIVVGQTIRQIAAPVLSSTPSCTACVHAPRRQALRRAGPNSRTTPLHAPNDTESSQDKHAQWAEKVSVTWLKATCKRSRRQLTRWFKALGSLAARALVCAKTSGRHAQSHSQGRQPMNARPSMFSSVAMSSRQPACWSGVSEALPETSGVARLFRPAVPRTSSCASGPPCHHTHCSHVHPALAPQRDCSSQSPKPCTLPDANHNGAAHKLSTAPCTAPARRTCSDAQYFVPACRGASSLMRTSTGCAPASFFWAVPTCAGPMAACACAPSGTRLLRRNMLGRWRYLESLVAAYQHSLRAPGASVLPTRQCTWGIG